MLGSHQGSSSRILTCTSARHLYLLLLLLALQVCVTPAAAQVQVEFVSEIGSGENSSAPDFFGHIADVGVDEEGRVYVLDASIGMVRVFESNGTYLGSIGEGIGPGPGEMTRPVVMEIGRDGLVYVEDQSRRAIFQFTREGDYLDSYHYAGNYCDLAIADSTKMFVGMGYARKEDRIRLLSFDGNGERSAPAPESASDDVIRSSYLPSIDISAKGLLLYADPHPYRIHIYNHDLVHLGSWEGVKPDRTLPPEWVEDRRYYYMSKFIRQLKYMDSKDLLFVSLRDDSPSAGANDVIDVYEITGQYKGTLTVSDLGTTKLYSFDVSSSGLLVADSRDGYPMVNVYQLGFEGLPKDEMPYKPK